MMRTELKKKCTSCKEWKEATTKNFYQNTSHGRKHSLDDI